MKINVSVPNHNTLELHVNRDARRDDLIKMMQVNGYGADFDCSFARIYSDTRKDSPFTFLPQNHSISSFVQPGETLYAFPTVHNFPVDMHEQRNNDIKIRTIVIATVATLVTILGVGIGIGVAI